MTVIHIYDAAQVIYNLLKRDYKPGMKDCTFGEKNIFFWRNKEALTVVIKKEFL